MKTQTIFFLILAASLTSCKSYYSAKNFEEITETHKTIAILPFEVYTKDYLPTEITESEVEQIKEYESKAFQASFYNKVLVRNRRGNKDSKVNVQHYSKTLRKLKENNISTLESWEKSPEFLANLLGVDAVVIGRVEKQKYFSDELSAGIDIGTSILTRMGVNRIPYVSRNNKNIKADYSILNGANGKVLWSINYDCEANWQQHSDEIIDNINHRSTKHFPYKIE